MIKTGIGERLNAIVQEAFQQYREADSAVKKAQAEAEKYPKRNPMDSDYYLKHTQAQHALMEASDRKKDAERYLREGAYRKIENLRSELVEVLEKKTAVNPEEVDGNMMTLLNSGLMTAGDYASMFEKAESSNNLTMVRLICRLAANRAEERTKRFGAYDQEADILRGISYKISDYDGSANLQAFDNVASGFRNHYSRNAQMWETWSEFNEDDLERI